jgi:hypothetical protein
VGQSQTHSVNEKVNSQQPEQKEETTQSKSSSNNQNENNKGIGGESEEQSSYSINIPFGEKLSKRPTVTPFDIISVGGQDETQVQSLGKFINVLCIYMCVDVVPIGW